MSDTRILSELFTATHLQRLAWYGRSQTLEASIDFLQREGRITKDSLVADVLETAFETLVRKYPIEYVYKACILKKTIFGTYSPNTTALYMEFPISDARADMLLVNGDATIFEVKTRYDTPDRVNAQLAEYYRCFMSVIVVVEEAEVERYLQRLPAHVGVSALTSRFSMSTRRRPMVMAEKLDHTKMFRLMHQKEYYHAVSDLGVDLLNIDPAVRYSTAMEYFARLPIMEAYTRVLSALCNRQRTKRLATLCSKLPQSLHASVFSYRLRNRDWENLVGVLSQPYKN